jgi:predicted TIM-barrel fold metal-dependent hydrolase
MDEQGIGRAVLIARITEAVEPEKSTLLLSIQRTMMNSVLLRPLAAATSVTFYDENGRLRALWRPFTRGGRGYVKTQVPDNTGVAEVVARHPDRFWGWIFLNPKDNIQAVAELDRWSSVPGMIGLKLHPYWHQFPLQTAAELLGKAEAAGMPVLVHLGFGSHGDYLWLLKSYPLLKVIFAHAGIPYFKSLWPWLREHPGAFVDLSSPHLSESFVRKAVRSLGAAKCLYGTDSPYGFGASAGNYDYGRVLGWVQRLPVSDQDRQLIMGENFLRIIEKGKPT